MAKKVEELKQEVTELQNEVNDLEATVKEPMNEVQVVEPEKKSLKEKAQEWGEKHPKLRKAGKAVGVAVVAAVSGVVGYALGKDSVDIDLVDRLMDENDDDLDIID